MIWKQYTYAALVGACVAFGVIVASRISDSGLGGEADYFHGDRNRSSFRRPRNLQHLI